jgi:hypothetical protein
MNATGRKLVIASFSNGDGDHVRWKCDGGAMVLGCRITWAWYVPLERSERGGENVESRSLQNFF